MLKLKLARVGKKKQPEYRIIVVEQGRDPWGPTTEIVGHYNPLTKSTQITWKEDRVKYWLSQGAQATDTVHNFLLDAGLIKGDKRKTVSLTNKRRAAIDALKEKEKVKEVVATSTEAPEEVTAPAA